MLPHTITTIVIFIFYIQNTNGVPQANSNGPSSPIQEAVQEVNPELDKITLRLKELKLDIYKDLLKVRIDLQTSSIESEKKILDEINILEINTQKTKEIAIETNTDIETCLCKQKEEVERILMVAYGKANRNYEENRMLINNITEKADSIIKEANDIDKNLNKIIGFCIKQNNLLWLKEKLVECLHKEANYLDEIVDKFYKEKDSIQNDIRGILNRNATRNNLSSWLSRVQEEFLKCVSSQTEISTDVIDERRILETPTKKEESINDDQKVIDENQGKEARIYDRIRNLEALVNRLKVVHQLEETDSKPDVHLKNSKEFSDYINNLNIRTESSTEGDDEKNKKFVLYISF